MILDTNALSSWSDGTPAINSALRNADRLIVPSIVLGEYYFGIRQSRYRNRYESWLNRNLPAVEIVAVTQETAKIYADIRLELKQHGTPIPSNDTWIAAIALQFSLPVLSNDAHFDYVDAIRRIAF